MANTTHCSISAATVVEGAPLVKWVNLAATDYPGYWEYLSATKTATKADSDTVAQSILHHPAVVEFKPTVTSTNARTSADTQLAAAAQTPLIIGGTAGPVQVVGYCVDQAATMLPGKRFIIHTTAGQITTSAAANTRTGIRLARAIASGDTYGAFWLDP
jgi:hypothetical protein